MKYWHIRGNKDDLRCSLVSMLILYETCFNPLWIVPVRVTKLPTTFFMFTKVPSTYLDQWLALSINFPRDLILRHLLPDYRPESASIPKSRRCSQSAGTDLRYRDDSQDELEKWVGKWLFVSFLDSICGANFWSIIYWWRGILQVRNINLNSRVHAWFMFSMRLY